MDWVKRLNAAISYMEEHLLEEIDYEQVAKIACCSSYHFQRMFAYLADVPLSEYLRRRRMSLAIADLQSSNAKIIDIALKYGYASPTAFNRAFQSVHGIAPSLVKDSGTSIKAFPPISFKIIIKGVGEMNYRIEKKDSFRTIGVVQPLHKEIERNFEIVPQMWQNAVADGTLQELSSVMDCQLKGILGICACNDLEEWRYYIAVASTHEPDGAIEQYIVPPFTWAIFSGEGECPRAIQELERCIVTEWLPTSGYEHDRGPEIELYIEPNPQNAKFEVWIPIIKKG